MSDAAEPVAPKSKTQNPKLESNNQPLPFSLSVMVESLLFVASEPVPVTQIAEALEVKLAEVEQALTELNTEIVARGVRVQRKGDKVQLTTQPECAPYVEKFLGLDLTTRLSKPALETLAIIAYQQPVTRAQIEHVRGVNCDGVLSTLLNRGLIEEVGRLETAGRPIQYGTTFAFLQHFGLRGLEDMPSLQPEEAVALEALAEQGQAIAVDLAVPADRVASEAAGVASTPDHALTPIETQLALLSDEAPRLDQVAVVAEQVDVSAEPEAPSVEALEADRVIEAHVTVDLTPDQSEDAIEPQATAEDSPHETAAL
ncbi:Segregation and condensation protein B [Thermoflexales bacterium]|nr:Segregation and condensation protein B [Thermoflexales bacterium]